MDRWAFGLHDQFSLAEKEQEQRRTAQLEEESIAKLHSFIAQLTSGSARYDCTAEIVLDGRSYKEQYTVYENADGFVKEYTGAGGNAQYRIAQDGTYHIIGALSGDAESELTREDWRDVLGYLFRQTAKTQADYRILSIRAISTLEQTAQEYTVELGGALVVLTLNEQGQIISALHQDAADSASILYSGFSFEPLEAAVFSLATYTEPAQTEGTSAAEDAYAIALPARYPLEELPLYEGANVTAVEEDVDGLGYGGLVIAYSSGQPLKTLVNFYADILKATGGYSRSESYSGGIHTAALTGTLRDWDVKSLRVSGADGGGETQVTITLER